MTVKLIFFYLPVWFPHPALFQRHKRKHQDGSDATITLFQHTFHWDPTSCAGRGKAELSIITSVFHKNIFFKIEIGHTLTCPSGAYTTQIQKLFSFGQV